MTVETPSLFAQVIQEHLELKRKNAPLERQMPISEYMANDPFENHPLFKTEEQARVEDTMSGQESILHEETSLDWPGAEETFISEPEPEQEPASAAAQEDAEPRGDLNGSEPDPELDPAADATVREPDAEPDAESEEGLWTRSRDFDWGD
jgi:hypothetical protein